MTEKNAENRLAIGFIVHIFLFKQMYYLFKHFQLYSFNTGIGHKQHIKFVLANDDPFQTHRLGTGTHISHSDNPAPACH
jgi:hypothetical protein